MRVFSVLFGILVGVIVGAMMLWSVASLVDRQNEVAVVEGPKRVATTLTSKQ